MNYANALTLVLAISLLMPLAMLALLMLNGTMSYGPKLIASDQPREGIPGRRVGGGTRLQEDPDEDPEEIA